LNGKAETVMIAPSLANNLEIGIIQVKIARQLIWGWLAIEATIATPLRIR
jgi:hypothetical protein